MCLRVIWASQVVPVVKNLIASARDKCKRRGFDPWVREIPLEKEMAIHSSILAWEIPWTKEPGRLHSIGLQKNRIQPGN